MGTEAPLSVGEVLRRSTGYLAGRGCDTARLDAELLVAHALGVGRLELYTDHDRPLTGSETAAIRDLVARRGRREPVAHLTGVRAFRHLSLAVGPEVLVPRPETEILVERVLGVAARGARVLDWGTGSGAVALALADERPDLTVTGIEAEAEALAVARANAERLGSDVELIASSGYGELRGRRFDVIVANPPYLSAAELETAPPELIHEPRAALVAGPTGLESLSQVVAGAPAHLEPGGWLLCEIGSGQADEVRALFAAEGFADVVVTADLAGQPRVVEGARP